MTSDSGRATTRSPSRRGRGRPKGASTAQTRERILAAAADLFAERGFHATSMTGVAEIAGLSQTGLLHHFPSKEELLAAVLGRRDLRDLQALAEGRGAPARGWQVWDDMVSLVRLNSHREPLVRLFSTLTGEALDPEHPGHGWLRQHHRSAREALTRAILDAVADGDARPDAPAGQLARQAVALMDGLQVQWLMDPAAVDMAADFAAWVETVRDRWGLGT
ncbi:TetR/AcrR family transcriptional regulator [Pedococcus sp. 5OH_020]|uniref:TetR/AcrR family transcriptional regulator n=1 Tax=Pedococcus sp. 5OH_020 TaxID=2989814 RepID=UPI0022E9BB31|nr:TetR/AcrR family transcriptional regulator [Pedococcus sp. 5OH_020]